MARACDYNNSSIDGNTTDAQKRRLNELIDRKLKWICILFLCFSKNGFKAQIQWDIAFAGAATMRLGLDSSKMLPSMTAMVMNVFIAPKTQAARHTTWWMENRDKHKFLSQQPTSNTENSIETFEGKIRRTLHPEWFVGECAWRSAWAERELHKFYLNFKSALWLEWSIRNSIYIYILSLCNNYVACCIRPNCVFWQFVSA